MQDFQERGTNPKSADMNLLFWPQKLHENETFGQWGACIPGAPLDTPMNIEWLM